MNSLPLPLVPEDIDLRDYDFFPLYYRDLFKSDTWAKWNDRQRIVGLRLWAESWGQEPASSLPDRDKALALLAGYGDSPEGLRAWRKIRPSVLDGGGWVKCSDGRWYHPYISSKALKAWENKTKKIYENAADRERKRIKRASLSSGQATGQLPFVHGMSGGHPTDINQENSQLSDGKRSEVEVEVEVDKPPYPLSELNIESNINKALQAYNDLAKRIGLPICQKFTEGRRRKLKKRLEDCGGMEGWNAALAKVEAIPGLRGKANGSDHQGWRCSIDFLLTESRFVKLMEGAYDHWGRDNKATDRAVALSADHLAAEDRVRAKVLGKVGGKS